jgi:hypothetical protein
MDRTPASLVALKKVAFCTVHYSGKQKIQSKINACYLPVHVASGIMQVYRGTGVSNEMQPIANKV